MMIELNWRWLDTDHNGDDYFFLCSLHTLVKLANSHIMDRHRNAWHWKKSSHLSITRSFWAAEIIAAILLFEMFIFSLRCVDVVPQEEKQVQTNEWKCALDCTAIDLKVNNSFLNESERNISSMKLLCLDDRLLIPRSIREIQRENTCRLSSTLRFQASNERSHGYFFPHENILTQQNNNAWFFFFLWVFSPDIERNLITAVAWKKKHGHPARDIFQPNSNWTCLSYPRPSRRLGHPGVSSKCFWKVKSNSEYLQTIWS